MKGEIKREKKFRNRGDYDPYLHEVTAICQDCGKEIWTNEPMFVRRDLYEYIGKCRIIGGDIVDLVRDLNKTVLCSDCVPFEEVVKRDQKYVTGNQKKSRKCPRSLTEEDLERIVLRRVRRLRDEQD